MVGCTTSCVFMYFQKKIVMLILGSVRVKECSKVLHPTEGARKQDRNF